jgi:hypothetical protein
LAASNAGRGPTTAGAPLAASRDVPGQEYGPAAVLAIAGAVVLMTALSIVAARALGRRSFILAAAGPGRGPSAGATAGNLAWFWLRALNHQRVAGWRKLAENRIGWVLCALIGVLLSLRLTGAWDRSGFGDLLVPLQGAAFPTVALASVVLGIAVAELTLGDMSQRVVGPALRAAVELGAPLRTAAAVHAASLFGPSMVAGALASVLAGLLLGWTFAVMPVVVAAGACAGSILGEHIFPPPRMVDGGAGESVATALASLMLATIPAIWTQVLPDHSLVLLPLSAAALLGGALWCVRRNLTTL